MAGVQQAIDIGRSFWDSFIAGDIDIFASLLAPGLIRIGPRDGNPDDTVQGKDAYVGFIRDIKATMPAHGGYTGDVGASADGTRAFVHCVEVVALAPGSSETVDVSNVLILHLDPAGLITVVDIYRKEPREDIAWTKASSLTDASQAM